MLDRGVRKTIEREGVDYLFEEVQPLFKNADFGIVNLECPVTELDQPLTKRYIFRGDPSTLPELRSAGITHAILANNHSYDHGRDGLISTEEYLKSNNIKSLGFGATQSDACEPVIIEKGGYRVAVFSSVLLPLESWMFLENEPGMCQIDADNLANRNGE